MTLKTAAPDANASLSKREKKEEKNIITESQLPFLYHHKSLATNYRNTKTHYLKFYPSNHFGVNARRRLSTLVVGTWKRGGGGRWRTGYNDIWLFHLVLCLQPMFFFGIQRGFHLYFIFNISYILSLDGRKQSSASSYSCFYCHKMRQIM